ncbi:MAG: MaoC family dehydratase N-terminal domain-containing protein [Kiloniellales bacterium]
MNEDPTAWKSWIGRALTVEDEIGPRRAQALQATLDIQGRALQAGDPLPPLWHWLYFWDLAPASTLGPDGHPERGEFLPPIELPRRMWAGSRVTFHRPLLLGVTASRRSTIADLRFKTGRSGRLAFLTLRHEIGVGGETSIEEEQDIVYLEARNPKSPLRPGERAPMDPPWRREVLADPVLLFRYSALTFNNHRIHYDHPYAVEVEGYPGLVVHGPLLATLMVDLACRERPSAEIAGFRFRAIRPVFGGPSFTVAGRPATDGRSADIWVADSGSLLAMRGQIEFR